MSTEHSTDRIDPTTVENQADRVVVSFRSPDADPDTDDWWIADSDWLHDGLTTSSYLRYLHWAHAGPVSVDDEWEEFVNCGCASPQDVILRVETIDGNPAIGDQTTIEIVSRKAVLEDTPGSEDSDTEC
ncbi:hypothetical protein EFA46_014720 (plasmid) [Halarchaeum sp. CBA1220]|uniref:DUF7968 domain-containing protein n=1 Tax=Halarchaeum grantii TaxID=1193105 RepID=A0A830FCG4_9EURY|nr:MULTISPECIES: hypothetical protein [Halarchaeum]QLC35493.1 hypothetical protein EFA46_014720 [Halarchaeum sp. CBA1220]GGL40615.1 hypothetical protein GCM10009037_25410 [Halarchaeum grantii]